MGWCRPCNLQRAWRKRPWYCHPAVDFHRASGPPAGHPPARRTSRGRCPCNRHTSRGVTWYSVVEVIEVQRWMGYRDLQTWKWWLLMVVVVFLFIIITALIDFWNFLLVVSLWPPVLSMLLCLPSFFILKWRFPKIGVPLFIIHFHGILPEIKPSILGYLHDYGNLYHSKWLVDRDSPLDFSNSQYELGNIIPMTIDTHSNTHSPSLTIYKPSLTIINPHDYGNPQMYPFPRQLPVSLCPDAHLSRPWCFAPHRRERRPGAESAGARNSSG